MTTRNAFVALVLCSSCLDMFAFVNEVLVITWQERCAPPTRWKVMARVLR